MLNFSISRQPNITEENVSVSIYIYPNNELLQDNTKETFLNMFLNETNNKSFYLNEKLISFNTSGFSIKNITEKNIIEIPD